MATTAPSCSYIHTFQSSTLNMSGSNLKFYMPHRWSSSSCCFTPGPDTYIYYLFCYSPKFHCFFLVASTLTHGRYLLSLPLSSWASFYSHFQHAFRGDEDDSFIYISNVQDLKITPVSLFNSQVFQHQQLVFSPSVPCSLEFHCHLGTFNANNKYVTLYRSSLL